MIARAPSRRFELPAAWSVDVGEYVTGLAWSPDAAWAASEAIRPEAILGVAWPQLARISRNCC